MTSARLAAKHGIHQGEDRLPMVIAGDKITDRVALTATHDQHAA